MLRRLSIRSKLVAMLLLSGIGCIAVTGYIADRSGTEALRQSIFSQLTTLRESKRNEVERYFAQLEAQFISYAKSPTTVQAMRDFANGFNTLPGVQETPEELLAFYRDSFVPGIAGLTDDVQPAEAYLPASPRARELQLEYIARNPYKGDEASEFVAAETGTPYDADHQRYHPYFVRGVERNNLSDVSLVDARTGVVVYTVYKGLELGRNLRESVLAQSGIGRVFENAMRTGHVVVEDFSPYLPSRLAPAAFMAVPILDGNQTIGILIAEISKDDIDALMTGNFDWANVGLGETGEAFLAGPDYRMRSASRFQREQPDAYYESLVTAGVSDDDIERIRRFDSPVLNQPVRSEAVTQAIRGQSGTAVVTDYRGVDVLSSWSPLDVLGGRWAIVAKKDASEALAPVATFRRNVVQVAAGAAAVLTLASLLFAGLFTRPIREVLAGVNQLAAGDEKTRLDVKGSDEFSELGRAFNSMADEISARTLKIEQKTQEYEALLRNVYPDIVAERIKMGDTFVAESVKNVAVVIIKFEGLNAVVGEAARETVTRMNELIGDFDEEAGNHGIEKLRTAGDTYVATCGLSTPRLDGVSRALGFVTAAKGVVERYRNSWDVPLTISAVIAIGDAQVGLVGRQRTVYEVWGPTITTARRMIFDVTSDMIALTKPALDHLPDREGFREAGTVSIKDAGTSTVWQRPIVTQAEAAE
ncbi:adenylate/guanylate cyclase domain-containing protein [Marinivivus vitaminiproducens]|uniref:adenylate/guanylate cyclase domain-containing protein n=1 Tax=Marinivivus vitaminiproducens TaxID=3035935 RepID=UPI002798CD41|nr:adenylate/guanylate cyclase domain-containing protein [Geminicoccaceae bacterium SCSIO 64248]